MRATLVLIASLLALAACGKPVSEPGSSGGTPPDAALSALEQMRADIAALNAKAEHDAAEMTVQHILIAFAGTGLPTVTRSREEAEQLAADLYARVRKGEDFRTLMNEFSDDTGGGIYTMVSDPAKASADKIARRDMVSAFGDTGWRLAVNEIGVAQFDRQASKYGWHIVQRIQ